MNLKKVLPVLKGKIYFYTEMCIVATDVGCGKHCLQYDMIYVTAIGLPPGTVVQYTFTHKQYTEQHNRHKTILRTKQSTQKIHRTTQSTQTIHRTTQSTQTIHRTTQSTQTIHKKHNRHKKYIEQPNRHKQYTEQHLSLKLTIDTATYNKRI